jgi:hypothetical protein
MENNYGKGFSICLALLHQVEKKALFPPWTSQKLNVLYDTATAKFHDRDRSGVAHDSARGQSPRLQD